MQNRSLKSEYPLLLNQSDVEEMIAFVGQRFYSQRQSNPFMFGAFYLYILQNITTIDIKELSLVNEILKMSFQNQEERKSVQKFIQKIESIIQVLQEIAGGLNAQQEKELLCESWLIGGEDSSCIDPEFELAAVAIILYKLSQSGVNTVQNQTIIYDETQSGLKEKANLIFRLLNLDGIVFNKIETYEQSHVILPFFESVNENVIAGSKNSLSMMILDFNETPNFQIGYGETYYQRKAQLIEMLANEVEEEQLYDETITQINEATEQNNQMKRQINDLINQNREYQSEIDKILQQKLEIIQLSNQIEQEGNMNY